MALKFKILEINNEIIKLLNQIKIHYITIKEGIKQISFKT